jgi:hypothetical protein
METKKFSIMNHGKVEFWQIFSSTLIRRTLSRNKSVKLPVF